MKKILLGILILSILLVFCFVLIPSNQVLSLNEFVDLMNNYGCILDDENVTRNCDYNIKYIENENNIKNEYNLYVSNVRDNVNVTGSSYININLGVKFYNNSTSGDRYKSVTLYKDKILYVDVPKTLRDKALTIEKELGFYYEPEWNKLYLFIIPLIIGFIYFNFKKSGSIEASK